MESEEQNWFPIESECKVKKNDPFYDVVFKSPFSEMSPITDNIYLTSIAGVTKSNFEKYSFQCIVDLCEIDYYSPKAIEHRKIRIFDIHHTNICDYFDVLADLLHENESMGVKTVVHCYVGVSRSASVIIAYLMKCRGLSLREAFNYVRKRRIVTRPNNGFFRQLIDYELHLFGSTSVRMVKVCDEMKKLALEVPDFFEDEHKDLIDREFGHVERGELTEYYGVPYE